MVKLEKIRVGFIGAGSHAQRFHYPSLQELDEVNLLAVCDLDLKRANQVASQFKIEKIFCDYKQMIKEVDLDAVYIVVPPKALTCIALYCLSQRLHVFMEKPPGTDLQETEEMARMAKKNECKTMVGFNRRFSSLNREAKRRVEQRGPITLCLTEYHKYHLGDSPYYGTDSWLVVDIIHCLDTLRWIGGEISSTQSMVGRFGGDYDTNFLALFQFKNGTQGILCADYLSGSRIERIEIHGKGIAAYIEPPDRAFIYEKNRVHISPKPCEILEGDRLAGSSEIRKSQGFFAEHQHFIDCIKKDIQPETFLEDAAKTMELVNVIQKKM